MHITQERIAEYDRALTATISAVRSAHPQVESWLAADPSRVFAADSVEGNVDAYLEVSAGLTVDIMTAINDDLAREQLSGHRPDEGVGRLAALLGGDLRVAAELATLAGRDPDTPDVVSAVENLAIAGPVGMTTLLDDIHSDPSVADILTGVAGLGVAGGAPTAPDQTKVESACASILDAGGKHLTSLGTAVALTPTQLGDVVAEILGAGAAQLFDNARDAIAGLMRRVIHKLLDVLQAAVNKIAQLLHMGEGEFLQALEGELQQLLNSVPGQTNAGRILGTVLRAEDVLSDCHASLNTVNAAVQSTRIDGCGVVAAAFGKSMKYVAWGTVALGVAQKFSVLSAGVGLLALEAVGAVLMAYVLWATHDYLDSPVLANVLPDRVAGLRHVAGGVNV